MKKFAILAALAVLVLSSCSDVVRVPATSTGQELLGMGVELDPHFMSQNVTRNDSSKAEDWFNIVVPRVNSMDVERFRIMLQPHWWEPYNDNDDPAVTDWSKFTFDSPEVQSVCAVLDMIEALPGERTALLVSWGCPISANCVDPSTGYIGRHFLCAEDGKNWCCRCDDDEEFAENFVMFVKWLVEEKGYTCVKEITPYNEPDGGHVSDPEYYIPTCKALAARIEKEGLKDRIKLNLSDNIDIGRPFLRASTAALAEEAALFNSHTYIFGYETPNRTVLAWERRNARLANNAGKPHFVGEFGSNQCVGASRQKDINWYRRGVLIVRNAVNFLNAGAAGASYWSLIDQYYAKDQEYEQMQQLGLWRYVEEVYEPQDIAENVPSGDYSCRPQYYAYSFLTRFVRKGDYVYPLNLRDRFANGTAVKSTEGKWTYIFANGTEKDKKFSLANAYAEELGDCEYYLYSEETLPADGSQIEASATVVAVDGLYEVALPAETVVVLRQK